MSTKKKALDESKITGANYIINFYQEIQALITNYANYCNILLEIKEKYGEEVNKASDEEKTIITKVVQGVRYSVQKTYIQYKSIIATINKKEKTKDQIEEDKTFEDSYKELKEEFMINRETLEKYVLSINKIFLNDVIKDLLKTSQDLVDEIYSTEKDET